MNCRATRKRCQSKLRHWLDLVDSTYLVRRSDSLVSVLELDGESDRVPNTVPTPVSTDARLDRSKRLSVGMTRLEASSDQLPPDGGKVLLASSKQVDPLEKYTGEGSAIVIEQRIKRKFKLGRTCPPVIFEYRLYFLATIPQAMSPSGVTSPAGCEMEAQKG